MEIDESLIKNELLLCHEYDEMEKGIADRDVYIIVLQMKLLAEKEEVEKLKTKMQELEHKNENMARDLRRVSQNYNQERLVVVEAAVMASCLDGDASSNHCYGYVVKHQTVNDHFSFQMSIIKAQ
jgi:uncharacterized ferredoxin-like protein